MAPNALPSCCFKPIQFSHVTCPHSPTYSFDEMKFLSLDICCHLKFQHYQWLNHYLIKTFYAASTLLPSHDD